MRTISKFKFYIRITFGVIALMLFVGCEAYLEEDPEYNLSTNTLYETPGGLEVGVTALYNLKRRSNGGGGFYDGNRLNAMALLMAGTDLGQTRTYHRPYGVGHISTAGIFSVKWQDSYEIIERANAIINNSANVEGIGVAHTVAEAKIIRAETYFDLYRQFENILLDTVAVDLVNFSNIDEPIEYTPAEKSEVLAVIDADLDYAIQYLKYDEPYARYSKSVARLLKGKSAMWQENYQEAADQFDAIINESGKSLVPVTEVFGVDLNHSETLFVYPVEELNGGSYALAGGQPSHLGSMFTSRLYEDGAGRFVQSVEYGGQALGWSHPNDYLQSLYGEVTIPDAAQPWFKRVITEDLRYSTYFYPETFVANNPDHPEFGNEQLTYDDNIRRYHFSLKKFFDPEKGAFTNDSWKDHLVYRLAEVYLLGAEAHWRIGDTPKALEYINTIRRRAYGVSDATYDFTEFTLDNYLEESARELAMEGQRWYLLKRLGLLVERQNTHYYYGSNTSNLVLEPMAPHMVNHPIPQYFIDQSNGQYPQNEGY